MAVTLTTGDCTKSAAFADSAGPVHNRRPDPAGPVACRSPTIHLDPASPAPRPALTLLASVHDADGGLLLDARGRGQRPCHDDPVKQPTVQGLVRRGVKSAMTACVLRYQSWSCKPT